MEKAPKKRPRRRIDPLRSMLEQPGMADEVKRLRALSCPELADEYERLWGKAPRVKNKGFLWKQCARRIQELRFGGLSQKAKERLEELIGMLDIDLSKEPGEAAKPAPDSPTPGTSLVREWRGERVVVRVLDEGFEWRDKRYASLSAIAKEVTGTHWNGRLFFGLKKRRERA